MKKKQLIVNSKKNKAKRGILLAITIIGMIVFLCWTGYSWYIDGLNPTYSGPVAFTIESGESIDSVAIKLQELGLISEPKAFIIYLRLNKIDYLIKSGDYSIDGIKNIDELTSWLLQGQEKVYSYTVPEGWTINQITMMLFEKKLISSPIKFMELAKDNGGWFKFKFQDQVQKSDSLEGYLYPETYFTTTPDEKKIIEQMLLQYDSMIDDEMVKRAEEIGMTWNEVMILASIVEKEAAGPSEMNIVSSVFRNRLNDDWPLQSCAALEYAVPREGYVFTNEEIKTETPYNTYLHTGLPPTPVCNPRIDAIKAVLWPAVSDYYFFVAKGDGTHAFGKTLEEHNRNVSKYIK